jgi:DNA replication protein DnaC
MPAPGRCFEFSTCCWSIHAPLSVAVYGDSGMGKTMICNAFSSNIRRSSIVLLGSSTRGSLPCNSQRSLYTQIPTALGVPQNARSSVVELEQVTIRLIRAIDVQVLLLDEVHNILAGTFREQRIVLNTLPSLV